MSNLRSELDALASALCKKAQLPDTEIEASTDALKAVAAYYAIREKVKLKSSDSEDGETSDFNSFSGAIHGAGQEPPNGSRTPAPSGRRRITGTSGH